MAEVVENLHSPFAEQSTLNSESRSPGHPVRKMKSVCSGGETPVQALEWDSSIIVTCFFLFEIN